jgi:hypothetical protein
MTCLNYYFHLAFFSKNILSTNGTAFFGSLNGKTNPKTKKEKNHAPTPNFAQEDKKKLLTMEFHIN